MFVPHQPPRPPSSADSAPSPAMLARLTTTKNEEVWVNPSHVRVVRAKSSYTEVVIDPLYLTLKIAAPIAEVVATLDAASPPVAFVTEGPPQP